MKALDLFAGAGGLSLGLRRAGVDVLASFEWDRDAAETLRRGGHAGEVCEGDVRPVDFHRFRGVDLIAGGPPCQPFSTGGKQLARADERDMIPEFIRAVAEARPRVFLMENVPGLVSVRSERYIGSVLRRFIDLGYQTTVGIYDAADFGVPQHRRRLLVIGRSDRAPTPRLAASHGPEAAEAFATSGNTLDAENGFGEANPSVVTYAKKPDLRPSPFSGHLFNGGGRAIDLSRPAPTILASAGGNKTHFVDTQNLVPAYHAELMAGGSPRAGRLPGARRLTVAESAALQSFPRGMRFAGSRSAQYKQVGNAIAPLFAERVARELVEAA